MATKAEQFKAATERTHKPKAGIRAKRSKPGAPPGTRNKESKHAGKKATYALEDSATKASRKSTRKASNRAKPDSAFNLTEQTKKDSPTARFRKSAAKATKAKKVSSRGKGAE
jgi:hypothetical protein